MTTPFIAPPCHEELVELYRDDHIVVVNKPSGLLSVPGKPPNDVDSALARLQKINPATEVVHRLDMSTSGVMVYALTKAAHRHLNMQFRERTVEKSYIADVWGELEFTAGTVDLPLRCDWPNRPLQMVCYEHGKHALTHFEQIDSPRPSISRVLLKPVTGRSHQLRVHMQQLGNPIIGCEFYAHDEAKAASNRLHLHAMMLSFDHPRTGERLVFECAPDF